MCDLGDKSTDDSQITLEVVILISPCSHSPFHATSKTDICWTALSALPVSDHPLLLCKAYYPSRTEFLGWPLTGLCQSQYSWAPGPSDWLKNRCNPAPSPSMRSILLAPGIDCLSGYFVITVGPVREKVRIFVKRWLLSPPDYEKGGIGPQSHW